jgi:ABC-type multidrug transport system fused ATPase/permease subunit
MRWRWAALVPLAVAAAAMEALGAAVVFFLIKVLSDPTQAIAYPLVSSLIGMLPWQTGGTVVPSLTFLVAAFYLLKNSLLGCVAYAQRKVVSDSQAALARRLLQGYLALPYAAHLRRNSAELVRNMTDSVHKTFYDVLLPSLGVVTEVLVVAGIIVVLMATAPWVTLVAVGVLFSSMAALLKLTRYRIARWGAEEQGLRKDALQSLHQSMGGLKEIKVMGRERFFYTRFARLQKALADVTCFYETLAYVPPLLVEMIFVFGMLVVILSITARGGAGENAIPLLGLCAYGGFRVIPALNRVLRHLNRIRFGAAAIDQLYRDLALFDDRPGDGLSRSGEKGARFADRIVLERVRYTYEGSAAAALHDIDLTIHRGESVGIVGPTGSGKSTLINIILGLLRPSSGRLTVDGRDAFENLHLWQRKIGFVPQEIYLTDDSLRRNIAFGLEDEEIDERQVKAAIRLAQLEDLVASLPLGLDTVIGERGIRLSGGERQRVAIARALYHEPELLVFDEATSALDNQTERALSSAIDALQGNKTLILIAHRLSTVRKCGRLIFLRAGRVAGSGSFEELLQTNREFRELVSSYDPTDDAATEIPPDRM